MKKFLNVLVYILIFILSLFLQYFIGNNNFFGIRPNFFICFIIALSIKNNIYLSVIVSLFIGLFIDCLYFNNFLIYTILFTLISLFINIIKEKYNFNDMFTSVLPIGISIFIYNIMQYGYFAINTSTYFSFSYFIVYNIISIAINLVITLVIYNIFDKLKSNNNNYWR